MHLAVNAHHRGDVDEADALLARLMELVDLAASGKPVPPRKEAASGS